MDTSVNFQCRYSRIDRQKTNSKRAIRIRTAELEKKIPRLFTSPILDMM